MDKTMDYNNFSSGFPPYGFSSQPNSNMAGATNGANAYDAFNYTDNGFNNYRL